MKTEPVQDAEASRATESDVLRENARLRGDLLTVAQRISHDLRTPLGGISVTGQMIKEMLAGNNQIPVSAINPISDSTEEIIRLIERVSFVLRASVKPAAKEPVKMGDAVFEVLQKLEAKILKKNATISQPVSWPEVNGVSAWLKVIWWNLLANSLQYAKHPPVIELGWENEPKDEPEGLRFWIRDEGNGVPVEKRGRLFQPFETLHQMDSTQGLGLSIVQRLVDLQGGHCGYEPRPEGGSVFYFILPAGTRQLS